VHLSTDQQTAGIGQSSKHNMWTEITRRKYEREGQRYASDLTDAEWALIEPLIPAAKRLGPATRDRVAQPTRCDLVHRADRLSVANAAQGVSALHHGTAISTTGVTTACLRPSIFTRCCRRAKRRAAMRARWREIDSQSVKTTESGEPRG
jgi:transposase